MLHIPRDQYARIIEQGLEGKPLEICGLLAGEKNGDETRVIEAFPIESDDKSPLTYTLNAREYMKATREIERRGLETVGIYHTHPATVAYPSQTDIARAHWGDTDDLLFPGYSYLIVSLRNPAEPEPHSFKINGHSQSDIEEEPVVLV